MNKNIIKPKVSYYMNNLFFFFRKKILAKIMKEYLSSLRNQLSAKIAMMWSPHQICKLVEYMCNYVHIIYAYVWKYKHVHTSICVETHTHTNTHSLSLFLSLSLSPARLWKFHEGYNYFWVIGGFILSNQLAPWL